MSRGLDSPVVGTTTRSAQAAAPRRARPLPIGLRESKLERPHPRPGVTPRPRVLATIDAAGASARRRRGGPGGLRQVHVLAQWAASKDPHSAWVSCDEGDNDPAVLMMCLVAVLSDLGAIDPGMVAALMQGAGMAAVPRLMDAVRPEPHRQCWSWTTSRRSRTASATTSWPRPPFACRPGWQIAMASRLALPLPLPRLRLQGGVLELGVRDLAMTSDEARQLLRSTGAAPDPGSLGDLLDSTEGWPVALYLAGLTMKAHAWPPAGGRSTADGGDRNRDVRRYLREEVLDQLSEAELTFLTRSSVLERLCGALGDATVGGTGSGRMLEQLERRNLLVVPLDRRREWYRYHHLLREVLTEELLRREPGLVPQLHARAAWWFETQGLADEAIEHAQEAGDADVVARLVVEHMQPIVGERPRRHGAALGDVVRRRQRPAALPGDRRPRRLDLRAAGPRGRGRGVGRGGADGAPRGRAARREHDGSAARLPARDPRPGRGRGHACGRPREPGRTGPVEPVPAHHAFHRGHVTPAGGRPRRGRSRSSRWPARTPNVPGRSRWPR